MAQLEHIPNSHPASAAQFPAATRESRPQRIANTFRPPTRRLATEIAPLGSGTQVSEYAPRKKVLFLITKSNWGGAQRYVYDLATNLTKSEFDAVVVSGNAGALTEKLNDAGVSTICIQNLKRDISLFDEFISFFRIVRIIRAERPDIVHLNSSKAAGLGALAARVCGVRRIIFTAHGWPFKEERNLLIRLIILKLTWITALLSTDVIVVSHTDERIGKRLLGVRRKIHYIPLGIQMPQFFSREEAASMLAVSGDAPRVASIAELTANKGIRFAIEAMRILKEKTVALSYFIIGDGEERTALEALARERGVTDRVHFLGFVPDAARYLKAFDVFLLPSIKEGAPYVLLEAAAASMPIVATTIVDPMPGIKQAPSGDAAALADTLAQVLARTPEYAVTAPLSNMVEKTIELYQRA